MKQRLEFIESYLEKGDSISELARQYGISRKTAHKWIDRFKVEGHSGLEDQSRAPHNHPNALCERTERSILEWKALKPSWGAPKIHAKLLENGDLVSESTVSNVLARHGLSQKMKPSRRATPSQSPFRHYQRANELWCADFKGHFQTTDGSRCDPLTISDGHTRYLLRCQAVRGGTGMAAVKPVFVATFRENGLPDAILTDNGAPFASRGLGGLSPLSVWFILLRIRLERIQPGHPEQNGRHERMHRTLKEATAQPPRSSLRLQQESFDAFRKEYNEERPHEALGQKPPATVYVPSMREYPERLPELRGYPDEWEKRRIRPSGQIKWKGWSIHMGRTLIGQEIGLEEVEDGVWAVYFETLKLGWLDEKKKRVRRIKELVWRQED
jgi:putative transposase